MNLLYRYGPAQYITGPSSWTLEMLAASVGKTAYDCDQGVGIVETQSRARAQIDVWAVAKRGQTFSKFKTAVLAAGNIILEEDAANKRILIARST